MTSVDPADGGVFVCLMARAPVTGEVKKRLVQDLGIAGALDAYDQLLQHKLALLADSSVEVELWMTGDARRCREVARSCELPLHFQGEGHLGQRMCEIVSHAHRRRRISLVTGVDLPAIDATYIDSAAAALKTHDVVVAPTEDGGYGLIGMRSVHPKLFEDVRWGSERVLEQTLSQAQRLGLSVALLPLTWDVDTAADWQRFMRLREPSP